MQTPILYLFLFLLFSYNLFCQTPIDKLPSFSNNVTQTTIPGQPGAVSGFQSGPRSTSSMWLNYYLSDEAFANSSPLWNYYTYLWSINQAHQVSLNPFDDTDNLKLKWGAVIYDSISDYGSGTQIPFNQISNLVVDSIFIPVMHENVTGQSNTITVRLVERASNLSGLVSPDQGITLTNTNLWSQTVTTTTSLSSGGGIAVLEFAVNTSVPAGKKFGIIVEYTGPKQDVFAILAGYKENCGNSCAAQPTLHPNNSYYYFNYAVAPITIIQGVNPDIFYDCDGNGTLSPTGCEYYLIQNFYIGAKISFFSPQNCSLAPTGILTDQNDLPCMVRNTPYSGAIELKAWDNLGGITVFSLKIDSITNLPCGITWTTDKPNNTFLALECGNILLSGITTDAAGQYPIEIHGTLSTNFGPLPGNLSSLGLDYLVRVTNPGAACPPVNPLGPDLTASPVCVPVVTCASPSMLPTSRISTSSARLNWTPVPGVIGYVVAGATINSNNWVEIPVNSPSASFLDVNQLQNGVTYKFRIKSVCSNNPVNHSAWSNIDTFTVECKTPANVHTPVVQRTAVRVAWERVFGCAGYAIQGRQAGAIPTQTILVAGSATTFKDIYGLQPNTSYEIRIRTWCDAQGFDKSPWSAWHLFTTNPRFEGEDLLNEAEEPTGLSFYPNPTTGQVIVALGEDKSGPLEVIVFNLHGKPVTAQSYPQGITGMLTLDLSQQASGLYFVTVRTALGTETAKVVKH